MTRREEMIEFLSKTPSTIKELAVKYEVAATAIVNDLDHIFKTLKHSEGRLYIKAAQCLNEKCEYSFSASRKRFSDPSRCPDCHGERIKLQEFKIKKK